MIKEKKIAVLGLGYVGLPLAVGLCSSYKTIGFDISLDRVSQLLKGIDKTLEVKETKLKSCLKRKLIVTNNFFISNFFFAILLSSSMSHGKPP